MSYNKAFRKFFNSSCVIMLVHIQWKRNRTPVLEKRAEKSYHKHLLEVHMIMAEGSIDKAVGKNELVYM